MGWVPRLHPHGNNSPSLVWQLLCTFMLVLDGGLLAYEWRFTRLHAVGGEGPGEAAPFPGTEHQAVALPSPPTRSMRPMSSRKTRAATMQWAATK